MSSSPAAAPTGGSAEPVRRPVRRRPPCRAEFIAHQETVAAQLERVTELEQQIRALQADQVDEVARFVKTTMDYATWSGRALSAQVDAAMMAEIAVARRTSVTSAQSFMNDACLLAGFHPHTLGALRDGRLALSSARAVVSETALLEDPGLVRAADEVIADEAVDVLPGKVRASPSGGWPPSTPALRLADAATRPASDGSTSTTHDRVWPT